MHVISVESIISVASSLVIFHTSFNYSDNHFIERFIMPINQAMKYKLSYDIS